MSGALTKSLMATSAILTWAGPVYAQSSERQEAVAAGNQEDDVNDGTIVVTGSRIIRDGSKAPTPVSVVGVAEIQRAATPRIADYVNQLPALAGSESPHSNNARLSSQDSGANVLNLRSLGTQRTLVLLNGRRVTPSSFLGSVDINTLPTGLISRVDVVTGGASAAFGSDAVAGVVNFILDTKYEGIKGSIQGSTSTHDDAKGFSAQLSAGTSFADNKGHVVVSGEYAQEGRALFSNRDWFRAYKVFANPAYTATNGQPRLLMNPYASLLITDEGLIASGPLRGYAFDANGQLATTNQTLPPTISSIYGADSQAAYENLDDLSKRAVSNLPVKGGVIYSRADYEILPSISVFAEGSYGRSKSQVPTLSYFRTGNATIRSDNFYLPAQVRTAIAAAGVTTIPLSTSNIKFGTLQTNSDRKVVRLLGGVEGKLGDSWSFDIFGQYGKATRIQRLINDPQVARYAAAIDAVANPANLASPICRSTLTNPTNGCVPINPFGTVPLTAEQVNYVNATAATDVKYRQDVLGYNLSGDVLSLPAGPLSVAFGGEYRRESATGTADAISIATAFFAGNYKPFAGRYSIKEAYGELAVPVFKDSALGTSLDLNAAGRVTDYSVSGTEFTWKLGGVYRPVDDLTLRVTRSRDIRAPNLNELFQGGQASSTNIGDPFHNGASINFTQFLGGNLALVPERADTTTIGAIYKPSWLRGFLVSVDYYDIKVNGSIATTSSQDIANRCFAGDPIFCSAITFNSAGFITQINLKPFNAQSQLARGIDVEASYEHSLGRGTIDLRAFATYVNRLEIVTSPGRVLSRAGEVGDNLDQVGGTQGVPRARALVSATYSIDSVTAQIKGRFISASKVESDYTALDINRNKVPAIFYLDAYVSYKLPMPQNVEVFLAADNLFDTAPPPSQNQDSTNVLGGGVSVAVYDVLGTMIRGGVRFKF